MTRVLLYDTLLKRIREKRRYIQVLADPRQVIQSGIAESLAVRFEVIASPHRSFREIQGAFGWNLEQFVFLWRLS